MRYFVLSPEVAGGLGKNTVMSRDRHPPTVARLHYEIDVWLGDELLEGFPCFIVTSRLADAVRKSQLSGAATGEVEVTLTDQFNELYPGRLIPKFMWLQVSGTAGIDDFGTDSTGRLVVSERALRLLETMKLENCEVAGLG